jgi:hypothetical protein
MDDKKIAKKNMKIVGTAEDSSNKRTKSRKHSQSQIDHTKQAGVLKPFHEKKSGMYEKIKPVVDPKDLKTRDNGGNDGQGQRTIQTSNQSRVQTIFDVQAIHQA